MNNSVALKLVTIVVTIVAPAEYRERVELDLREQGAGVHASWEVSESPRDARQHGPLGAPNVRIESLVTTDVAERLLSHIAKRQDEQIFAFANAVEAVPASRFKIK